MKYTYKLAKCYEVWIEDEDGNTVESTYVYCNRKEYAEKMAKDLLWQVERSKYEARSNI